MAGGKGLIYWDEKTRQSLSNMDAVMEFAQLLDNQLKNMKP